ncbi:MAG: hypothetical protein HND47_15825 [Chloroflexi bacterium]|nr:hypothetical protein [Chloroflexota bacterium]
MRELGEACGKRGRWAGKFERRFGRDGGRLRFSGRGGGCQRIGGGEGA